MHEDEIKNSILSDSVLKKALLNNTGTTVYALRGSNYKENKKKDLISFNTNTKSISILFSAENIVDFYLDPVSETNVFLVIEDLGLQKISKLSTLPLTTPVEIYTFPKETTLSEVVHIKNEKIYATINKTNESTSNQFKDLNPNSQGRLVEINTKTQSITTLQPDNCHIWECYFYDNTFCCVVSDTSNESAWYNAKILLIDLTTKESKTVDAKSKLDSKYQISSPKLINNSLYFIAGPMSDRGVTSGGIFSYNLSTQQISPCLLNKTNSFSYFEIYNDQIVTLSNQNDEFSVHTFSNLLENPSEMGSLKNTILSPNFWPKFQISNGKILLTTEARELAESFLTFDLDKKFNFVNSNSKQPKVICWNSEDGTEIHGYLYESQSKFSTLAVHCHGGPIFNMQKNDSTLWGIFNNWLKICEDLNISLFVPLYRGSPNRGLPFTESLYGHAGTKDCEDIESGIDYVKKHFGFEKVGLLGWSYGGYLACQLPTRKNQYSFSIAGASITDWYSFWATSPISKWVPLILQSDMSIADDRVKSLSPLHNASKINCPFLIFHGEKDICVPHSQSDMFFNELKKQGKIVKYIRFVHSGHGPDSKKDLTDVSELTQDWIKTHI